MKVRAGGKMRAREGGRWGEGWERKGKRGVNERGREGGGGSYDVMSQLEQFVHGNGNMLE